MASEVEIANLALTALGEKLLISLDDETTPASLAKLHYAPARDAVLEAREWTFAVKRATLAKLEEVPNWGYGAAFQIPADLIRIVELRDTLPERVNFREIANRLDWRREGDMLLCDAVVARVRYLSRVTDPNEFSPMFIQCLAAYLAMNLAIPITQSRKLFENMEANFQKKLVEAAASDGIQGRTEIIRSSRLTGVRGVGSSVSGFAGGTV